MAYCFSDAHCEKKQNCTNCQNSISLRYSLRAADTASRSLRYDLVIIPALYSAKESYLNAVNSYVEGGGNVIASFKSGFSDEYLKIYSDTQPHIINKCLGIHYDQFTYPKDITLTYSCSSSADQKHAGAYRTNEAEGTFSGKCTEWMELVTCDSAESLAAYDHKYCRYRISL